MRPKHPRAELQEDLFRARPQNLVDPWHALVRLAGLIDWSRFEVEFEALYTAGGRPGLPTRLMVGVHLLKHMDGLSSSSPPQATTSACSVPGWPGSWCVCSACCSHLSRPKTHA